MQQKLANILPSPSILVEENKTSLLSEMCKKYKVSTCGMLHYIRKEYPNFTRHKLNNDLNYDFFEIIDTEEKAYWLGYFYADGNVNIRNNKNRTPVSSITSADLQHLEKFKKSINSNHKISLYKKLEQCVVGTINIYSDKFGTDLIKLGCVPCKSLILTFPTEEQVPEYLLQHFIRGYFDGDGCIYVTKNGRYGINFIGTLNMVNVINNKLHQLVKIPNQNIHKSKSIFSLAYSSKIDVSLIYHYLYDNATIFLERKYNRFVEAENKFNNRVIRPRFCCECNNPYHAKGCCRYHYYYNKYHKINKI